MSDWCLVVEGSPDIFTTAGVSSITSYSDEGTAHAGTLRPILGRVTGTLSERLRPIDGTCEVSVLDFVLHDTGGRVVNNFTRSLDEHALTHLTASASSTATTLDVQSATALGTLPRIVWIGAECVRIDSIAAGNTVNVTRALYATRARAIAVDATRAELPRVYSYPCWMTGRRVRLYRVDGAVATLRWIGYVAQGPIRSDNGASSIVSCRPAIEQESSGPWGVPQPAATVTGYNARAFRLTLIVDDGTTVVHQEWPVSNGAGIMCATYLDAIQRAASAFTAALTTRGATNVHLAPISVRDGQVTISVQYGGLARGEGILTVGGEQTATAQVFDNSGVIRLTWRFPYDDGGALVLAGARTTGAGAEPYTPINPTSSMATSWAAVAGTQGDATLTPLLVGDLGEDTALELDPTGLASGGLVTNDSTSAVLASDTSAGVATFHGAAKIISRDPASTLVVRDGLLRQILVSEALPLRSEVRVSASHWLDAMRSTLENTTLGATRSDPRNWSWSGYARARRETRDALGAVEYRTTGNLTVGELVAGECAIRGACLAVDGNGRLTVTHVRSPQADETPANTITASDLIAETVTRVAPSDDGLVTSVVYVSPVRTVTLQDAVAIGQYDTQREVEVTTQSFRRDNRLVNDPIGFALTAVGRLLSKWRQELWVYSLTVSAQRFGATCTLGAVIEFDSYNAPNRSGGIGFTGRRGTVIGRSEDLETGQLTLDVIDLATVYGFSPCCRIASISSAQLTIAGGYAGDADDYAGSTLTGYRQTSGDYGVGWFAAGDKVRLVLRDSATYTSEDYTVSSVDTALRRITLTSAVNTAPTNWPSLASGGSIVDVVFDSYATSVARQRIFAAVADETTRLITTGVRPHRWAP